MWKKINVGYVSSPVRNNSLSFGQYGHIICNNLDLLTKYFLYTAHRARDVYPEKGHPLLIAI